MTNKEQKAYEKFCYGIIEMIKIDIKNVKKLETSFDISTSVLLEVIANDIERLLR